MKRPSPRVLWIPVVLAVALLLAGWLWPFFAPFGPVRAAQAVVGPADTITLSMRPGTEYLIYHEAPRSEVGRVCRFGSPGHIAGGIGFGGVSRADVAYRGIPSAVTLDGRTFRLAMRVNNSVTIDVPISCEGGPLLAETMPPYTAQAVATRNIAIIAVALSVVGSVTWWLARSLRTRSRQQAG